MNSNRDDAKQQKHRSVSNIVVSKTKQLEPTTFSTTTTTQDKYNRKKRLSYSDFIRPQVRSVSTPNDTRAKKILPAITTETRYKQQQQLYPAGKCS